jgi:hypothetical protein
VAQDEKAWLASIEYPLHFQAGPDSKKECSAETSHDERKPPLINIEKIFGLFAIDIAAWQLSLTANTIEHSHYHFMSYRLEMSLTA